MTRVLIALTSVDRIPGTQQRTGFHAGEAIEPWDEFRSAGYDVDFVSVAGGQPPVDARNDGDALHRTFFEQVDLSSTPQAKQLRAEDYDAIVFAGGHGTMWDFPDATDLSALAADIYERGGVVAAVCHGPAALVNLKLSDGSYLVSGKNVAAFTNAEEEAVGKSDVVPFLLADALQSRGAIHHPADNFTDQVVVDGRLVTGQNPASARHVGREVVALLR